MKAFLFSVIAAVPPAYFISYWSGPEEWRWWAAILSIGLYGAVMRYRP